MLPFIVTITVQALVSLASRSALVRRRTPLR